MARPRKSSRDQRWVINVSVKGVRRTISLGKIPKREAYTFGDNLETLLELNRYGQTITAVIRHWIDGLCETHKRQLSELGLFGHYNANMTVQDLIDMFWEDYQTREDVSKNTASQFRLALKNRFPYFLKEHNVFELEPKLKSHSLNADPVFDIETKKLMTRVESWQREHYAKSSWSHANKRIRQVGNWAVSTGILRYSPFTLLKCPGEKNPERIVYVPREVVEEIVDFCIDQDTRLVLILGRYAGLRLPSEIRTIKWSHIDFTNKTMQILDSKKKKYRTVPLFARIEKELMTCERGEKWLMSEDFRRATDSNNYNKIIEAINRSGHERWVRLRQNLRTSCENDLLRLEQESTVIQWLGHTTKVSREHYQKTTPGEYLSAVEREADFKS